MKRAGLLALFLLTSPAAAQGQVELGIETGLQVDGIFDEGDDLTRFGLPTGSVRIGAAAGRITFDVLASFSLVNNGGGTGSSRT